MGQKFISLKRRVKALNPSDIPEWTLQAPGYVPNSPEFWGLRVLGMGTDEAANLSEKLTGPLCPCPDCGLAIPKAPCFVSRKLCGLWGLNLQ